MKPLSLNGQSLNEFNKTNQKNKNKLADLRYQTRKPLQEESKQVESEILPQPSSERDVPKVSNEALLSQADPLQPHSSPQKLYAIQMHSPKTPPPSSPMQVLDPENEILLYSSPANQNNNSGQQPPQLQEALPQTIENRNIVGNVKENKQSQMPIAGNQIQAQETNLNQRNNQPISSRLQSIIEQPILRTPEKKQPAQQRQQSSNKKRQLEEVQNQEEEKEPSSKQKLQAYLPKSENKDSAKKERQKHIPNVELMKADLEVKKKERSSDITDYQKILEDLFSGTIFPKVLQVMNYLGITDDCYDVSSHKIWTKNYKKFRMILPKFGKMPADEIQFYSKIYTLIVLTFMSMLYRNTLPVNTASQQDFDFCFVAIMSLDHDRFMTDIEVEYPENLYPPFESILIEAIKYNGIGVICRFTKSNALFDGIIQNQLTMMIEQVMIDLEEDEETRGVCMLFEELLLISERLSKESKDAIQTLLDQINDYELVSKAQMMNHIEPINCTLCSDKEKNKILNDVEQWLT